ncbi:MAG: NHLP leader peptide family RiPP precursor [Rubrobacteraceae bacterium]
MSAATGGDPQEVRQRLVQRSVEDEVFRQRLLAEPKATIEQETGVSLPEEIEIRCVEETPQTVYLVLPPKQLVDVQSGELSDQELEVVAGGWGSKDPNTTPATTDSADHGTLCQC